MQFVQRRVHHCSMNIELIAKVASFLNPLEG
ncbi:MAG: type III secretion system inner rod subunit SctI [Clostridia bacterium]|nr:type III secretion system inner rod subunit SctI [Clostridia bacterium]